MSVWPMSLPEGVETTALRPRRSVEVELSARGYGRTLRASGVSASSLTQLSRRAGPGQGAPPLEGA